MRQPEDAAELHHGGWHRRLRPGGMTVRRHGSPRTTTAHHDCASRTVDDARSRPMALPVALTAPPPRRRGRVQPQHPWPPLAGPGSGHATRARAPGQACGPRRQQARVGTHRGERHPRGVALHPYVRRHHRVAASRKRDGDASVAHHPVVSPLGGRKGTSPMVSSPPRPAIGTDNVDVANVASWLRWLRWLRSQAPSYTEWAPAGL